MVLTQTTPVMTLSAIGCVDAVCRSVMFFLKRSISQGSRHALGQQRNTERAP